MTKEDLEQSRQLVREENEPIRTDMTTKQDLSKLENEHAHL
jgi:hypothetical protein